VPGEPGLPPHQTIRWRDGPWDTDVRLTAAARRNIPGWFRTHGFVAMQKQIDDRYMIDN
jgi:hypothetical protein